MNWKKLVKKALQWSIYLIVAAFVFITLKDNFDQVKQFEIAKLWLLVPAMLVFSVMIAVNSYVWSQMMKFAKEKVRLLDSVDVYISSYIIRYIPGNVWAIIARATMNKKHGVGMVKTTWGWLIENVSFLLVGLLFSLFAFSAVYESNPVIIIVAVVALVICAAFVMRYEILEKVFDVVVRKRLPENVQNETEGLDLTFPQRFSVLGMFVISWVIYSVFYFLIVNAIVGAGLSDFFVLAGINALSWSIGYLSIVTPSGSGVREGVMLLALTAFGLTGEVDAIVIALVARFVSILGELLYFGFIKLTYFSAKKWNFPQLSRR